MAGNKNTAEAIVVLGLRFDAQGEPQPELYERITAAASLHRHREAELGSDEPQPIFIVSGGYPASALTPPAETEEGVMRRYAISQGVPRELICGESQSLDTWGNAIFSKRIAVHRGIKRLRIVTSSDHLRYAIDVFRHTTGDSFDISGITPAIKPLTADQLAYQASAAYHMRFMTERSAPGDDLAIKTALLELIPAYRKVFPDLASPNLQEVIHTQHAQRESQHMAA